MMVCVFGLASPLAALAADGVNQSAGAKAPSSLLDYWLALPQIDRVAWPFAYIRADSTTATEQAKRKELFAEFDRLSWRLEGSRYSALGAAVNAWRDTLSRVSSYRLPGSWGPAWLMAHPSRNPPIARINAIGVCDVPTWIEVWDRHGVTRIEWRSGMTLSSLIDERPDLDDHIDEVALVSPSGEISHRGVASWNFVDANLSPGMRIVAPLPLQGEAFPWIRDATANLLAHTPAGDACRELTMHAERQNG